MTAEDPVLDSGILETLRDLQQPGGRSVLSELIDMFLNDSRTRMEELRRSVEKADFSTARAQAHTLKGSSGSLGALSFSRLCGRVETGAMNAEGGSLKGLVPDLEEAYARVREALEAERTA